MPQVKTRPTKVPELCWLSDVRQSGEPLPPEAPIWVRHGVVTAGPTIPHPERHPYCEFGILLDGRGIEFVGREEGERQAGDLFLAGPGVPHWFRVLRYPIKFATVYFTPSLLIELGPKGDGATVLRRFTAKQPLSDRLVRPPDGPAGKLRRSFEAILEEFEEKRFGREMRLRILLMQMLVDFLRWEKSTGRDIGAQDLSGKWQHVEYALHYLRAHFSEPIYAHQLANAARVSETRLKVLFREALGMTWGKYLQGYRIHRAAALLGESNWNVTETALAVGFESLSHFDATFHSFMGVSPRDYAKDMRQRMAASTYYG
jgi:AraC family transcriptional regulator, L-rhamnose operon transcriptional activator RhaR